MEKRKLSIKDIDKVRDIEGFPIGSDEDIIALSDAPYYTACPNPFIEEFVRENGHPYDETTDDYHREPFATDVSEGKSDPIYNAHTYHTKVPHKAIMRYILHYTEPGDIVFDGFCGTGMTGVAAHMCGNPEPDFKNVLDASSNGSIRWGTRAAILNDLSPIASYISYCYNTPVDVDAFEREARKILNESKKKLGWMYQAIEVDSKGNPIIGIDGNPILHEENYTVWSDVYICPTCSREIDFYDTAFDPTTGEVAEIFDCPNCGTHLKKKDCEKAMVSYYDQAMNKVVRSVKQLPKCLSYNVGRNKRIRRYNEFDNKRQARIDEYQIDGFVPIDLWTDGEKPKEPIKLGLTNIHMMYSKRNLSILSDILKRIEESSMSNRLKILFTSQLINISKLNRYRPTVSFPYNPLNGTLYIASMYCDANPYIAYDNKIKRMVEAFKMIKNPKTLISCGALNGMSYIPENSVDYIFTDPPFGANLNYSELSNMWEAWLRIKTNNKKEAIINISQNKKLAEYQQLMTECFEVYYKALKPNRWMTVEFHNSKNSVWNAIQESLSRAGFIVADVRTLDKTQGSFNQVKGANQAIKQDLVISAYKPTGSFSKDFKIRAGTDRTTWAFVRQHLSNLPITVKKGGKLEILAERQAFLLWDRMVAYHIMHGIAVPMDATDFYKGLDEKYIKRDGMYFLPNQVNKYDAVRATSEVENIQFALFVSDEKSAIGWLYQQLDPQAGGEPQTYQELMPKFMQELKAVDKREKMPELMVILEENFLKDDKGRWYIPDYTKSGDVAKLREKNLLKEFAEYQTTKGKLKVFRSEAIRAGFAKLWKEKDYNAIVEMAERLPEETIQEDSNLLMYYDISLSRAQSQPTQMKMDVE